MESSCRRAHRTAGPCRLKIYRETCVYCRGAPGQDPGDIRKRLNPEAPYLPDMTGAWSTAELFWIIKNGIRITGMASYGKSA